MENLSDEFPIESQTSPTDKMVLLQARNILRKTLPSYTYLEIGSYLGGSLTPFLKDPQCLKILSIDERNRQQPDERGAKFDYSGITDQTMRDNLKKQGLDIRKLETFDGSISRYGESEARFDALFVDGEHTDFACFRDFIHGEKLLRENSIILFHDSSLIYKSLRIIQEYLLAANERFRFIKIRDSDMSCIFRNSFAALQLDELFPVEQDLEGFYRNAELALLAEVVRNRLDVSINVKVKDMPTSKAF
jgi:hypothetical protein